MNHYSRGLLLVAALVMSATACKKKPVVDPPIAVGDTASRPRNPVVSSDTAVNPRGNADDDLKRTRIEATRRSFETPIYFGYDMADLDNTARADLDYKIRVLEANPTLRIRIEGHCDSRGSNEYNIALGQRRAVVARQYLEARGIAASRIETVSLGEERPAMQGENEEAWKMNRRDQFLIIAGSITEPVDN